MRLQDPQLRGRTVHCPDCQGPVDIVESAGQLAAIVPQKPSPRVSPDPPLFGQTPDTGRSPWVWRIAGVVLVLLVTWMFWPESSRDRRRQPQPKPPQQGTEPAPSGPTVDPVAAPATDDEPPLITTQTRFAILYTTLLPALQREEMFPAAQSKSGLSWLGLLEQANPAAPPYRPGRPWTDVANDQFVRRRVEAYQLPGVPDLVGEDGYPASHLVGIAGVGRDATRLPATHPRAGIFSLIRRTRLDDVTDGLANTLLVSGARQQLGSWAAPGTATLRSLTTEPYIDGPDGLGTGEAGGMHVLLADGSVRWISADVDAVVLRRMAAMADGLTLDPQQSGDPLTLLAPGQPVPNDPRDPPLLVELAPEPPLYQVDVAVAQRLTRFEQSRPLPMRTLLAQWSELAALPVDVSHLTGEQLAVEYSLRRENVTLRELLDELVAQADIVAEYSDDVGVVLRPR
ncbi:MAG: hypothetical protein KDA58_10520 [Planctomycetaceae bacterium]|nr:hypothetical protein [Planctomycetaceae bacterium]